MSNHSDESQRREADLDKAMVEYNRAISAGRAPDLEQFLAQHPDLAPDLRDALDPKVPGVTGPSSYVCPRCLNQLDTRTDGTTCNKCHIIFSTGVASRDPFPIPYQLGQIELTEVIGCGGFGTVYKGWDSQTAQAVAVKALRKEHINNQNTVTRFLREGQTASQFDHPWIVSVHAVGESAGVPFLVSDFVGGGTLTQFIRDNAGNPRHDRPSPKQIATWIAQLSNALQYIHEKNIFHRDIKTSNILIDHNNDSILADFGLALSDDKDVTITEPLQIIGTLPYMSPEQARGDSHRVTGQSDIYSLGVVMYELLTGNKPFSGDIPEILEKIKFEEPVKPRSFSKLIHRDLETICLKCLEKNPAHRYLSAADLAEDLRLYLEGKRIKSWPVGNVGRFGRWSRRNPALAISLGGVAALLLMISGISIGWALDSDKKSAQVQAALEGLKRTQAETELDRGLGEAERGDVGLGMLWMAKSLESLPPGKSDLEWTIRVNLNAWRRELFALTECIEHPPGRVLGFSPDGGRAWFLDADGRTVRGWDLGSAHVVGPELRHDLGKVEYFAVSPDGKRVACAGGKLGVCVWDLATGTKGPSPTGQTSIVGMTFAQDGKALILAIQDGDRRQLKIWDGMKLDALNGTFDHTGLIAMAREPNGQTLILAGGERTELWRWDQREGKILRRYHGRSPSLNKVAVSPDGTTVLTGDATSSARVWDVESGRLLGVFRHNNPVSAIGYTADASKLLTADAGTAIRVWSTPAANRPKLLGLDGAVREMALSPDGGLLATRADDMQIQLWSTAEGRLEKSGAPLRHSDQVLSVAMSPTGSLLATTTLGHKGAQLWNVLTRQQGRYLAHPAMVKKVCFTKDGRLVATVGGDQDVWMWETESGRAIWQKPLRLGASVRDAAFSPSGEVLVTAGDDRKVTRWDVTTGNIIGESLNHSARISTIAFSPADHRVLLAAGEDGIMKLWNVESGTLIGQLTHGESIAVATFTPDGRVAITGGRDGVGRVWDVETGRELERTMQHDGEIRAVAVSRTGQWAVTVGDDGAGRVWGVQDGRPIGRSVRHEPSYALRAVIDPENRWFFTSGMDGIVQMHLAPAELKGDSKDIIKETKMIVGAELSLDRNARLLMPNKWRELRLNISLLNF